jgi:hypothetical protein
MRARVLFVIVAFVVVGGFAAQNWPEFQRTVPLNFGVIVRSAPLGEILLGALLILLLVFLISAVAQESRHLAEHRRYSRSLEAQRDLAEKAEASRFNELRQYIDTNLRESRQRDALAGTEFEKSMLQGQRELRNQLEQMNRTLATQLGELECRLDAHLQRPPAVAPSASPPVDVPAAESHRHMNV